MNRSLVGYSPWGCEQSEMTERLTLISSHQLQCQLPGSSSSRASPQRTLTKPEVQQTLKFSIVNERLPQCFTHPVQSFSNGPCVHFSSFAEDHLSDYCQESRSPLLAESTALTLTSWPTGQCVLIRLRVEPRSLLLQPRSGVIKFVVSVWSRKILHWCQSANEIICFWHLDKSRIALFTKAAF